MINRKKKNQSRKANNPVGKRKFRLFLQRSILAAKLLLIAGIVTIFTLIYLNINFISKDWYKFTANLGFTVEKINVEGQNYTTNEKIGKILKIKPGMPIFAISLDNLKERLENLEWIKHANVKRELPNSINISIIERTPIALGQKDRKLYIIDDEGMVIREKNLAAHSHLPIIIGEGAEIYANSLIKMLKVDEDLFKHITSIIRVSERRWNVRFDNDLEVKLPEEEIEVAWQKIVKMYKNKELFLPENASLDLRIANKIYVEKK